MGKLILMTVGTSVFDNSKKFNGADLTDLQNAVSNSFRRADIENAIAETMGNPDQNDSWNLSAEMSSLIALNRKFSLSSCDWIILLHSADLESEVCAHINALSIVQRYFNATALPTPLDDNHIKGLKDYYVSNDKGGVGIIKIEKLSLESNENDFLDSMAILEETVKNIRSNFPDRPAYFNVTGGLKGVIPVSTVLSLQHNMSIFYRHEEGIGLCINHANLKAMINNPNKSFHDAFTSL